MEPAANQRVSANRVVLILALLLAVWLGFQFYPRRKEAPPPLPPVAAESKLQAVGLANNPDWEGLPEHFAVWADHIIWAGDKVEVAYWNPGSRSYAYFFEVTRSNGNYRFRALSRKESEMDEHLVAEIVPAGVASETHPFVFFIVKGDGFGLSRPVPEPLLPLPLSQPKIKVDMPAAPLTPPPPRIETNDQGTK